MNEDPEEIADGDAYRVQLLNGDVRFNKFVELTDMRFRSQARRTNKRAKETNDRLDTLANDLAPVIELARALATLRKYGGIIATTIGGVLTLVVVLVTLGVIP